jgi:hypothetical protein
MWLYPLASSPRFRTSAPALFPHLLCLSPLLCFSAFIFRSQASSLSSSPVALSVGLPAEARRFAMGSARDASYYRGYFSAAGTFFIL